jgi:hypothetical protein
MYAGSAAAPTGTERPAGAPIGANARDGARVSRPVALLVLLALGLVLGACNRTTGTLDAEQQRRVEAEGIVRRAVDLDFRRTHDVGTPDAGWEDGYASIVVTHASVLIHSNERVLLEITPRSTGEYRISRDRDRLSLRAGRGGSVRSWAFRPPDDPEGWANDIRAVIRASAGEQRRRDDATHGE